MTLHTDLMPSHAPSEALASRIDRHVRQTALKRRHTGRVQRGLQVFTLLSSLFGLAACSQEPPESKVATEQDSEPTTEVIVKRAGAPLFDGMSDYSFPISSTEPYVQRYFDQGMVLAFAFNHAESIRSFRAAQRLDPRCAICYWGEALATGPNINVTSKGKVIMSPAERAAAFAAIQTAVNLKDSANEKEQALIDALSARYNGDAETPREPLDLAWAEAMGEVAAIYPEDATLGSIYAEALMNTMPWNYWSDDLTA
ncbi:MAG: hypothetical protein VW599_08625, partial [Pseudomonadales bacterium]